MMAERHLPHELITTNILTRLPAKSLGQCKSVDKAWKSDIEDPKFIKLHHEASLENESNLSLVLTSDFTSVYVIDNFLDQNSNRRPLLLPRAFEDTERVEVVGAQNGLLCIASGKCLNDYCFLNPNMRNCSKTLPFLPNVLCRTFGGRHYNLDYVRTRCLIEVGFGYDHISGAYKVVCVFIMATDSDPRPEGFVYGSKAGSWRSTIPPNLYSNHKWIFGGELNNSLHFATHKNQNVIVTFDLHDEEWGEILLPCRELGFDIEQEYYVIEEGLQIELSYEIIDVCVLRECLSVLVIDVGCKYPSFWVWKEYGVHKSWTMLFTIRLLGDFRILYYSPNSSLVLLWLSEGKGLIWYDYKTQSKVDKRIDCKGIRITDAKIVFTGTLNPVPGVRSKEEVGIGGEGVESEKGEGGKEENGEIVVEGSKKWKKMKAEKKRLKKEEERKKREGEREGDGEGGEIDQEDVKKMLKSLRKEKLEEKRKKRKEEAEERTKEQSAREKEEEESVIKGSRVSKKKKEEEEKRKSKEVENMKRKEERKLRKEEEKEKKWEEKINKKRGGPKKSEGIDEANEKEEEEVEVE